MGCRGRCCRCCLIQFKATCAALHPISFAILLTSSAIIIFLSDNRLFVISGDKDLSIFNLLLPSTTSAATAAADDDSGAAYDEDDDSFRGGCSCCCRFCCCCCCSWPLFLLCLTII